MEEHRYRPPLPLDSLRDKSPLRQAQEQVEEFLAGQRFSFALPIELLGTPFQLCVWRQLFTIPYGETACYAEIAKRVGAPRANRAVGSAIGRNPLPLVVPCHRIIGAAGAVGGYSGGVEQKRSLLTLEAQHAAQSLFSHHFR